MGIAGQGATLGVAISMPPVDVGLYPYLFLAAGPTRGLPRSDTPRVYARTRDLSRAFSEETGFVSAGDSGQTVAAYAACLHPFRCGGRNSIADPLSNSRAGWPVRPTNRPPTIASTVVYVLVFGVSRGLLEAR